MNKGKFISFLFIINFYFIEGNKDKNIRKLEELSDDIVILHINDAHCAINKTIGYDGFALYRNEMKKKYKNVITVDVGDHIQGGSVGSISKGEAIIKLMNKIEFNVVTIGIHEFEYGIDQLYKLGNELSSKYICSNFCFRKNKTTVFEPYKIIEAGNKKIGFIGVLTPLVFSKTYLSSLKDENNEPIYDLLEDNNEKVLFERVQENINELKNDKKVDYIVLLTHIGMSDEEFSSEVLLSKLENADIVIDGKTHEIYNTTIKSKNNKEIKIVQAGTKLEFIGQIIIKQNGIINSDCIISVPEPNDKEGAMNILRDGQERWVDKEINNFIDNIWKDYSGELNKLIGYSNIDFLINSESDESSLCEYQKCGLGVLIADAMKESTNTEIAILSGGTIINNLLKGNLTNGQIINAIPWYNNIVVKRVPGQVILDALEFGVRELPNPSNGFPQVSGLTFDINTDIDSSVKTENDIFINVDGERRVSNVKVNEEDLNLTKLYNVSLLEFIGNGGDGYSMFTKYKIFTQSLLTDTDSLIHYIKYNLEGVIPEKYEILRMPTIPNNSSKSQETQDNLNPKVILISFHSYMFYENPYMIEFDVIIRIVNYPENEAYSLAMTLDIEYIRLRFLEEEDVTCTLKSHQMSAEIYDFHCLKEINGPISRLSVISANIIINGKAPVNSSTSEVAKNYGENMQNQTSKFYSELEKIDSFFDNCTVYTENNKLIFEGETNGFKITSRESLLAFGQGEYIKNIVCDITEKGNNKFKMVCEPTFIINVNFKGNNAVYLNNLEKIIMMRFEEGNSSTIFEDYNSNIKLLKKTSSEGSSKGLIFFIIILFIALLVIIIIIVYLCKKRAKETNQKNETNPSEPSENKTTLPSESKDTITKNNISGGAGLNINKDKKNL